MMHTMTRLLLVLAVMFTCTSSWAAVPEALNYSGFLSTDTGPAVGPVNVLFELYTAEIDGSMVWSEQHNTVALDEGYFDLRLGETHTLLPVMDGTAYWLQVSVDGELLLPRSAVVSVPYALRSRAELAWIETKSLPPASRAMRPRSFRLTDVSPARVYATLIPAASR